MNNTTHDLTDVKQLLIKDVESVCANMWKTFVSQIKVEEVRFWKIDLIVDDVLSSEAEYVMTAIGDTSSTNPAFHLNNLFLFYCIS